MACWTPLLASRRGSMVSLVATSSNVCLTLSRRVLPLHLSLLLLKTLWLSWWLLQTLHHFVNCAMLAFVPFFVLERGSTLYARPSLFGMVHVVAPFY